MTNPGTYFIGVDVGYENGVIARQQAEAWLRVVAQSTPEAGMRVRVIDSGLVLFQVSADSEAAACAQAVEWLRAAIAAAPSRRFPVRQLSCKQVFGAENVWVADTEESA